MKREKDYKKSGQTEEWANGNVSLITTDSFKEGLLRAVNLGGDTDTIGAIAGGLAGLYYGYNSIPMEWRKSVIKAGEIVEVCEAVEKMYWNK